MASSTASTPAKATRAKRKPATSADPAIFEPNGSRLVAVSNRVALPRKGETQAGGLAVALREALKPRRGMWFGWSGHTAAETGNLKRVQRDGVVYATIDIEEKAYKGFYAGFSNATLWPLFHFRLGLMRYDRKESERYREVNEAYAEHLMPLLRKEDQVWVHDYQLIPLGAALRARGAKHPVGFFLHIPFPPWAVFSAMPEAEKILEDMLAYDRIGLQTSHDRDGLLDCFRHGLGLKPDRRGVIHHEGRAITIGVHPVPIDSEEFARTAQKAFNGVDTQRLRESVGDRALIMGAERLDYTKGLPERLRGFASLLANYPQHRGKVTFLQIGARSRGEVATYAELKRELDSLAGRINGDYGQFDWTPVRYVMRAIPRDTLAGFYRASRVGFVTPLRDGMNLVAKEYIAAQDPEDPGVLVLSKFAGAAEVLDAALLVNPLDAEAMAAALDQAINMSLDERKARWRQLMNRLEQESPGGWAEGFLSALPSEVGP
ncbi:trehalose-6-phosphate synthase [Acetobacteraceae bacterium H6797]|nr:trehalose-6-phosphate synthase [Acetobacteraceae bacterium H6797]